MKYPSINPVSGERLRPAGRIPEKSLSCLYMADEMKTGLSFFAQGAGKTFALFEARKIFTLLKKRGRGVDGFLPCPPI
ncbi:MULTISPECIES: hypothetical protein [unclassified Akkermansia]|uniref:hypothetical protein n=1 Tax=unclassified Akkermansia TaxID=2608915 RepID=UPI0025C1BD78|nr:MULTISPECIES: hypothetical protein [unclassified Akkermansia]